MEYRTYESGYKDGYKDGYNSGYQSGYTIGEEQAYKFFYDQENGRLLIGNRTDTMYYAMLTPKNELDFFMSRNLPWGEEHNGYKFPRKPIEISFTEWLERFLREHEGYKLTHMNYMGENSDATI